VAQKSLFIQRVLGLPLRAATEVHRTGNFEIGQYANQTDTNYNDSEEEPEVQVFEDESEEEEEEECPPEVFNSFMTFTIFLNLIYVITI